MNQDLIRQARELMDTKEATLDWTRSAVWRILDYLEAQTVPRDAVWHYRENYLSTVTACGLTKDDNLHHVTVSQAEVTCPKCIASLMPPASQETAQACEHSWTARYGVFPGALADCRECPATARLTWVMVPSTPQKGA